MDPAPPPLPNYPPSLWAPAGASAPAAAPATMTMADGGALLAQLRLAMARQCQPASQHAPQQSLLQYAMPHAPANPPSNAHTTPTPTQGPAAVTSPQLPAAAASAAASDQNHVTIMFALRAPATHDGTHPYSVRIYEPVVLSPSDAGTPAMARSLVETLMQAHSTMPLAGPTVALVRNLLSVTPNLTEIVRGAGGVATNVPSSAQWHLDLMNRAQAISSSHPPSDLNRNALMSQMAAAAPNAATVQQQAALMHQMALAAQQAAMSQQMALATPAPTTTRTAPAAKESSRRDRPRSRSRSRDRDRRHRDRDRDRERERDRDRSRKDDRDRDRDLERDRGRDRREDRDRERDHERDRDRHRTSTRDRSRDKRSSRRSRSRSRTRSTARSRDQPSSRAPSRLGAESSHAGDDTAPPPPALESLRIGPEHCQPRTTGTLPGPAPSHAADLVHMLGKLTGTTAADMSRRSRRWERRFDQIFGDMFRPQFLYLDEDANMLSFWVPRFPGAVAEVMSQSGLVVGGARFDFEPADANDLQPDDQRPPERDVYVLVNTPNVSQFANLLHAMRSHGLFRIDADLNYDMQVPGCSLSYGYLSLAPDCTGRAEDLNGVRVGGKKLRVFRLHDAKAMFADPARLEQELRAMGERVLAEG